MVRVAGFWSYVHQDDAAEGGRISELARDVAGQYELLTGQSIDLFLDRDAIQWGDRWRDSVEAGIQTAAFFVAIITPRYFQSAECRNELQSFARKAKEIGVSELVVSLRYVETPELEDPSPTDPLVELVKEFQWEDWTDLRFHDRDSATYRRAVGELAERLAEVNRSLDSAAAVRTLDGRNDLVSGGEPPGTLDLMEAAEIVLPQWVKTTRKLGEEIEAVGTVFRAATEKVEQQNRRGGSGFAGRVAVARQTARGLTPHAERILELGTNFSNEMHDVDSGVQAILRQLAEEAPTSDQEARDVCAFLKSIGDLASAMVKGLEQMDTMLGTFEPLERMSRDLRLPLREMRQGLTAMREGNAVAEGWLQLIERVEIDCEHVTSS